MKKIQNLLWLLVVAITVTSCNPDDGNSPSGQNDDTFSQNFGTAVNRDFIGQVVDADNNPIQGVTVKIGSSTIQTDINGVFVINNASVYEKFAYITAKKTGYIDGSRSLVPTTGKNNVKIMMIPFAAQATIQSGEASEVSIYSGTKVKFDGAFQDENGNDYSGAVQVALFHLTPSDTNISSLMPGMLYAQTETNQEAILETFGMINVELRGSGGQKLNIKSGHTAEITVRIDDSQLATAPSTIPLWHFDEAKGYWKQDGVATKIGNKYVGEVSHFSWWNCDAFAQMVRLTVTIVDSNGNEISNAGVGLIANGNTYPVMGYTNTEGQVSGLIPANQTLVLNVYASYYTCDADNIIYTTTIGPFSSDTVLPNVVVNLTSSTLSSTVQGNLLKCNGSNVTNGYVILNRYGNYSVSPVTNGAFSFSELYCPDDTQFTLKGVDLENFQQTDSISYNFVVPITNVGNLQACNSIDEFISYQIDNDPTIFIIDNLSAYWDMPYLEIQGYNNQYQQSLYISGFTNVPGLYNNAMFVMEGSPLGVIASMNNTVQYSLNQFGAVGEYIDMTFSGTYQGPNNETHTVTGVVHVIRDN